MNTLSKLMGVGLLAVSSLAVAESGIPDMKDPAPGAAKPMAKAPKDAPKPANSSSSQRWSKNQEDLSILKQELEILELQKKISAAEQFVSGSGPAAPAAPGEMLKGGISSSEIFVDRVFGVEDDLQARVFFDSHIMTVRLNDEVADGIVVSGINSRGISLRSGKKTTFIPLTTTSAAAERAFPAGVVMGVNAAAPEGAATSMGGMQLPPGAFPAGALGMPSPPPISTGP